MNTRKVDKREQHVRKKLTAAILMLLISCIMTVTSTYAWFTLSTAPEVTGIQTTIGGNGNLEIALANGETWLDTTKVGTLSSSDGLTLQQKNITWGNLVNVSEGYGVNHISLSPAAIHGSTTQVTTENILQVPKYGADGRVSGLDPAMLATFDSTYNNTGAFVVTESTLDDYGLRAIGISTARTARQSSFAAAKATITSSRNQAQSRTSQALADNGNALANLAVKVALSSSPSFTKAELNSILTLITDTQEAVGYVEDAIIALVDAAAASSQAQSNETLPISDADYLLINAVLKNATIKDTFIIDATNKTVGISFGEGTDKETFTINNEHLYEMIQTYNSILNDLTSAYNTINDEITANQESYTWLEISPAVNMMMNMGSKDLTVGGQNLDTLKSDVGKYAPMVIQNPVVELGPDSGLYADIASLVGSIKASILMSVNYGEIKVENINATITATNELPIIPIAASGFSQPSAVGSEEANEISDIYGFVLDLLFRTNAENSDLLLQTTAVDRIYESNANEETMGNGSTMTFTKTVSTFSDDAMLRLMDGIRIVFMDENGIILGKAALDTGYSFVKASGTEVATHALLADGKTYVMAEYKEVTETGTDNVTYTKVSSGETATHAKDTTVTTTDSYVKAEYVKTTNYKVENGAITVDIRMLAEDGTLITEDKKVTKVTYTEATNGQATHALLSNGTYAPATHVEGETAGTYVVAGEGQTATHAKETDEKYVKAEYVTSVKEEAVDPVITPLTQNVVSRVSVLVYLDGYVVDNSDVANASSSMTGTMNLQFASSAQLEPMEYSGLHVQNPTPDGE